MTKKGILERLKEGPVLGDGGYLLELEKRGWVRAGPFTPEVALVYPQALRELHVEFREAGADVLQALTFYASRDKLAISAVVHKAFVEVNEEGAEAAGATVVEIAKSAAKGPSEPPVPEFRADRPFLYLIRDRRDGGILFLGRLVDPSR